MILCVGLAGDDTFVHTLLTLKKRNLEFDVIDVGELILDAEIHVEFGDSSKSFLSVGRLTFAIDAYEAAFVRILDLSEEAPSDAVRRRSSGVVMALYRLFRTVKLRVLNRPNLDLGNYSKALHSGHWAKILGWQTPRSCLTNRPELARRFIGDCKPGAVFKGASSVKTWATAFDNSLHADRLALLAHGPALFQDVIPGSDARVHAVANFLAAEVTVSPELDYRTTRDNRFLRVDVPNHIAHGCRRLTRESGVPFLGIDFKVHETTGEWWFLEANSLPCYQGYDRRAGGAIGSWLSTGEA